MVLYLSIIGIAAVLIVLGNMLMYPVAMEYGWLWVSLATIISIVVEFCVDGIFAAGIHALPDKLFSPDKKIFSVGKRERKFYEKVKIKSWKDKVWELGGLGGFRKNKLADPSSPEYIYQFMVESNIGYIIHIADCIVGFFIFLLLPLEFALTIGLPIAIVNLFLNYLSIMVLRYNTPKLRVAYERASRLRARGEKVSARNNDSVVEKTEEKSVNTKTSEEKTPEISADTDK